MQDDEKIDAFVVRNTGYYREKWQKFHEKPGSFASFNVAACLGQIIWLAYRKLYGPLFWAIVVLVADVSLWLYAEEKQLVSANVSAVWSWAVAILLFVVFGFLGNYWYWRKFRKVERQAASTGGDSEAQLQFIRSRGGTSPVVVSVLLVVLLAPVVWALYWGVYQASKIDYSAFIFDATGPLTLAEIEANFLNLMDEPLTGQRRECVVSELEERARAAGDPETLDPASVEFLSAETWYGLDAFAKRLILAQAITTKALFDCAQHANGWNSNP